jgi:ABC-type polysaccharide/polyol phosphate transport system ATPase subunit
MSACISFEGVCKRYRIGGAHYRTLREDLSRAAAALTGAARKLAGAKAQTGPPREPFYALRDLSFQIQQGERVGIIGPNGAGKTTALRLMGRITAPTSGIVRVRGKVGALIAVGAGIHPELSGRENVFLYGSIMGLKRREIQAKFDEIVAFAGISEFLDTPMKYYSSGMRVRLGFSVAVHTDPDIMLIDEVMAVGDVDFQRRGLDKITSLGDAGCTIIYVSHELNSVVHTCQRAICLHHGRVLYDGGAQEAVNHYLDVMREAEGGLGATPTGQGVRWGSFQASIEVRLFDGRGRPLETLGWGEPMVIEIHYRAPQAIPAPEFGLDVKRNDGLVMFNSIATWNGLRLEQVQGEGLVRAVIEHVYLAPGTYTVSAFIGDKTGLSYYDLHVNAYPFKVTREGKGCGVVAFPVRWEQSAGSPSQVAKPESDTFA